MGPKNTNKKMDWTFLLLVGIVLAVAMQGHFHASIALGIAALMLQLVFSVYPRLCSCMPTCVGVFFWLTFSFLSIKLLGAGKAGSRDAGRDANAGPR